MHLNDELPKDFLSALVETGPLKSLYIHGFISFKTIQIAQRLFQWWLRSYGIPQKVARGRVPQTVVLMNFKVRLLYVYGNQCVCRVVTPSRCCTWKPRSCAAPRVVTPTNF